LLLGAYYPGDKLLAEKIAASQNQEEQLFRACKTSGPPKAVWEPMRLDLKKSNDDAVVLALNHITILFQ
jgi:hypothetical protein